MNSAFCSSLYLFHFHCLNNNNNNKKKRTSFIQLMVSRNKRSRSSSICRSIDHSLVFSLLRLFLENYLRFLALLSQSLLMGDFWWMPANFQLKYTLISHSPSSSLFSSCTLCHSPSSSVFSSLFSHPLISGLLSLVLMQVQTAVNQAVGILFKRMSELDNECFQRFSEWFSLHLNNTDWNWNLQEWYG